MAAVHPSQVEHHGRGVCGGTDPLMPLWCSERCTPPPNIFTKTTLTPTLCITKNSYDYGSRSDWEWFLCILISMCVLPVNLNTTTDIKWRVHYLLLASSTSRPLNTCVTITQLILQNQTFKRNINSHYYTTHYANIHFT